MKFFDSLFKNKSNSSNDSITSSFSDSVEIVIQKINNSKENLDQDAFFEMLCKICKNNFEATEIYIFLPIAFVRLFLPKVNWSDTYNELDIHKKEHQKTFRNTESYQIILNISQKHFNSLSKETIIQIAGRSAEFDAINKLLLDNEKSKIEDIQATETFIIR